MPESKRRWIPSLVWLLVAIVLMAGLWVFVAVWLPYQREYQREQPAIEEIYRLGGSISMYWDGPGWLQGIAVRGWFSEFYRVDAVNLSNTHVNDEGLKNLGGLSSLFVLRLENTQISDEGLKNLGAATNLSGLSLDNTQVSDKGLKHLAGLANLSGLSLDNTEVADEGLKHLGGLANLSGLSLDNTQISNEGLKHLSGLTNLSGLSLNNTQVSDEGLKHLAGLTRTSFITPTILNIVGRQFAYHCG